MKVEIIERDDLFWEKNMKSQLTMFFTDCMLPEIINNNNNN